MEPFDTNIDIFDGINMYQRYFFSFYSRKSTTSLSPFSPQSWIKKITKIKFCIKIKFEKKSRHWDRIICVILKVRESKCIFSKTFKTPPMFDGFSISVPILPVPPLTKKSEASGLEL
jgi:hypothetical protein